MSRWWRAHASALDDPKVQRLPGETFKAWFNVLCIACLHEGTLPPLADIAFALRKSEDATAKMLDALQAVGLLDVTENGLAPHNWNGRQYKSDVSTARVKEFRERRRNVSVTPSESDSETETEADTKANALVGAPAPKPKRKTTLPKDWKPTEEQLAYAAEHGCSNPTDTAERFRLHHLSKGTLGADWNLGFQYWCRNEKKFNGGGSSEDKAAKRVREVQEAIERSALQ